jgi:arylsulfatase A-like enzyme
MIVRWPGVVKPGSVCEQPVIIEDFFPSVLEIAGMRTPPKVDGRSFVPLLRWTAGGLKTGERSLYWHYPNVWGPTGPGIGPFSAIRRGDWKLIFYHAGPRFELFNLAQDIGETTNLYANRKDKAKELTSALARWLKETGAQMPIEKATGKPVRL